MTEKIKTLSLSKLKTAETEGEHRITFVASTANEDRDYEVMQIDTFRLPLKGGGHIKVAELGESGSDKVDIPLLTNHNLWDVESTIGSVRKASYVDGKLIFEAGISSRAYAQDMFKLVEEGHLDNAFSIQFRDFDYDNETKTCSNGEIVEVSLVTRGSNKDAQVLAVKGLKGENMNPEETKAKDAAPVEENADTTETGEVKTEDQSSDENSTTENDSLKEVPAESAEDSTEEAEVNNDNKEKSMSETTHTEAAMKQVKTKAPSQTVTSINNNDYLKSKQAEKDFARVIAENYGKKGFAVKKAWEALVRSKGVTGDEILPTRFAQIFFKAWEDRYEALGTFRRSELLTGHMYAWNTTDRAKAHTKKQEKTEQEVTDIRRDYDSRMVYKMLGLEQEDLIRDGGAELLRMRSEDLSGRIGDEIVRAIIFGDGRTAPATGQPDNRIFDGVRGPWNMVNDINNSTSKDPENAYAAAVATKLTYSADDTLYMKIVRTLSKVKGGSGRKIVFLNEGAQVELALETDSTGRLLFAPGTNFQSIFGDIYIFESPYMEDSGYDVIAYREGSYWMALGEMIVRGAFDLKYNRDMLLMERMVGGTLYGNKVAAGYPSK